MVCSKESKKHVDGIKAALGLKNHERYSSQCIIPNLYTNSQDTKSTEGNLYNTTKKKQKNWVS